VSEQTELQNNLDNLREQQTTVGSDDHLRSLRTKVQETQQLVQNHTRSIGQIEGKIKNLEDSKRNRVCLFGQQVPDMLREIDSAHRKGAFKGGKPVGPIGM
jgi:chromosome segregation ATPase